MPPLQRRSAGLLFTLALVLTLLGWAPAPLPAASPDVLEQRLAQWPAWSLPAPLPRPGNHDLDYPAWFEGTWQVSSHDLSGQQADISYTVRFQRNGQGAVVGDRAFNASAIGRALLGDRLLSVQNDPLNPNRQLALLAGDQQLESTVVGRRISATSGDTFLADELALQVLHGPGDPRVSRVETLSRYHQLNPGQIAAEQWQGSYASPAEGLKARSRSSWQGTLNLERLPN
jgi:hypothetical protein